MGNRAEWCDVVEKFGCRPLDLVSVAVDGFIRLCEQRQCTKTAYIMSPVDGLAIQGQGREKLDLRNSTRNARIHIDYFCHNLRKKRIHIHAASDRDDDCGKYIQSRFA